MMKNNQWRAFPKYILRKAMIVNILNQIDASQLLGLEIGYGSGDMLLTLAKIGFKMHGYDFSAAAWQMAQQTVAHSPNIKILQSLPSGVAQYDFLFAFEVLEHLKSDRESLNKWHQLLKKNGYLLFSVPAHMSHWNQSDHLAGHYRRYEKKSLIKLLKANGFKTLIFYNYAFPLSLITDKLCENNLINKFQKYQTKLSMQELTKISGTDRQSHWLFESLSNRFVLWPFILLQQLFKNFDWGSSYLILAQKISESN